MIGGFVFVKAIVVFLAGGLVAFSATVTNGGFETGNLNGWTVLQTNPSPVVDTSNPHSGTYSALLGTPTGPEPLGDGSLYQNIGVVNAGDLLTFWYRTFTTDSITFDWQDAYITDAAGSVILSTIFHQDTNLGWTQQNVDLTPWVGQSVGVKFLVHQDGFGDDTSMNVDDVAVTNANAPEPFSAGLSLAGLGAIVVGALRRQRSA